ncbi:MAG TPA: BadF/BadG/BcrA/BcrD ATPase family protein [Acidocella sp.]|nr:BadF/BadG/BcrA/BcrD ATPase family protein [Acidocella sp.]
MQYVVGIDGGGTACRAALADRQGRILGRGQAGAANIRTDLLGAQANIMTALAQAAAAAGVALDTARTAPAVLGLAGANSGTYAADLAPLLPFQHVHIVNDGIIAMQGALGPQDGVVGIIGTGSVFVRRREGETRSIGGWGFQLSDLGSGARLGRQLLEDCLLVFDGVRPATPLTDRILAAFGHDPRLLVEQVRDATPAYYGGFVPMLVEAAADQDPLATGILEAGCRDIAQMLEALLWPQAGRLCLLGGLAPVYAARLGAPFQALLREPLGDALQGAVTMAAARLEPGADG